MRKWLFLALSALAVFGYAQTEEQVRYTTLTLTFGHVRQADGTWKSVKGMKIPLKITPVPAKHLDPMVMFQPQRRGFPSMQRVTSGGNWYRQLRGGGSHVADQTIYSCDTGSYAIFDGFFNPSSLDDVQITAGGVGKLWNKVTFGWDYSGGQANHSVLVRWRVWDDEGTAAIPGNAFNNELADFGGVFSTPPGTYKGEATGLEQAGMICDDQQIYMAEQFRDPGNLQGEGAFDLFMQIVFNNAAATIGFSDDLFWYDSEPGGPDGNYSNPEEQEQLSEGWANLLYVIKVSSTSTVDQVNPITLTVTQGTAISGDIFSLYFNNDANTFNARGFPVLSKTLPWLTYECEGLVATTALTSYRVIAQTMVAEAPMTQKIEIYRYGGGTPGWIKLDESPYTSNVPMFKDLTYGGSVPLNQLVGPGNRIKMRVSVFVLGATSRTWTMNTDYVHWIVTR